MLPEALHQLVGSWRTEATHPARPGLIVRGTTTFEWLGEGKFLVQRAQSDQPEFPNAVSLIGDTDGLRMHYFDERGVHRLFEVAAGPLSVTFSLIRGRSGKEFASGDSGFWQKLELRIEDGKLVGKSQVSRDNVRWDDDLAITYWRAK